MRKTIKDFVDKHDLGYWPIYLVSILIVIVAAWCVAKSGGHLFPIP